MILWTDALKSISGYQSVIAEIGDGTLALAGWIPSLEPLPQQAIMDHQMDDAPQQEKAGTNYGTYQAKQRNDVQYLCAGQILMNNPFLLSTDTTSRLWC